jgi:hypothetical protein
MVLKIIDFSVVKIGCLWNFFGPSHHLRKGAMGRPIFPLTHVGGTG